MLLSQDPETGWWVLFESHPEYRLGNTHDPKLCADRGCAIHNHPTPHRLSKAPLNWRSDRNILERICEHGVGHPDYDAALYQQTIGRAFENVHGCDGCCYDETPAQQ